MLVLLLKSTLIWLLFLLFAIVNGMVREKWFSSKWRNAAQPVSGIALALIILLIGVLVIPTLGVLSTEQALLIGGYWSLLTLAFDFVMTIVVRKKPLSRFFDIFDVYSGNLFLLVLVVTFFSPLLITNVLQ